MSQRKYFSSANPGYTLQRRALIATKITQLRRQGIFYVRVLGEANPDPCSAYLEKIFYIGDGLDPTGCYPRLDATPNEFGDGGPPYHEGCDKTIAAFVLELSDPESRSEGLPDAHSIRIAELGTITESAFHYADAVNIAAIAKARHAETVRRINRA